MLSLKLFATVLLLSCLGCWSQSVEHPQFQIVTGQDTEGSSLELLHPNSREAKRQKHQSPNVHIENIYSPQQIQKGDESVQGYPIYPVYTYPLSAHYDTDRKELEITRRPPKRKHQIKPKPSPTENQLPDTVTHRPLQPAQQPFVIYANPEQGNEYISLPYPGILSQHPAQISSGQSSHGYPYFVIINSPHLSGPRQPKPDQILKKPITTHTEQEGQEAIEEEDTEIKPIVPEVPQTPKRSQYKAAQLKRSRPQLRQSESDSDRGLAIAKYLLGQPAHSANNEGRSAQQNIKKDADADEARDEYEDEEHFEDDGDDDEEEVTESHTGNIDEMRAGDDFQRLQDALNNRLRATKGNKLPVDFILGTRRPSNKIDDRVALVYLRHSKRGRQILWTRN